MKRFPSPLVLVLLVLALILGLPASACSDESAGNGAETPEPTVDLRDVPNPTPLTQRSGVNDQRVLFGQSAAFSGPAWELGTNMQLGILTAFHEGNQAGGVHGRRLELVSLDDSYEPEVTIANTHKLIDENEIFALIGAVGTPTSRSAVPIASEAHVPYVAPFTGAAFLRDSGLPIVVNLRASYNQETEEMVARLTEDLGIERIAVLYQDDSFGLAGLNGARAALDRRDMEPVSVGFYPRNTVAVKSALLRMRAADPEAIIMVGAYQPVATFVSWARRIGLDPVFITISFVGSNALAEFLGTDGENVLVTQVVPFPSDSTIPVVSSYLNALSNYDPEARPGWVSLEGYLAGRLAITGLQRCGPDLTRDCFLDAITGSEPIDLDGFGLKYGFADNQGSDKVFLTVIGPNGEYRPIENLREVFQ